ncbi:hypothetical protein DSM14862_01970 [Sulfitobacter indolifex]|uniref:Secreted protein n=2 Tax=Sulfitobacter indolifex TaxID=225422 RepID=A0ABP2DAL2_9RHOB|nr:hypothetical protein OIHEL45_15419 [Sulfitobacter indolifex HEL-45]UOA19181.1 hypothetical protein DSM14862_01970 [Sulfitobacter indolifex]
MGNRQFAFPAVVFLARVLLVSCALVLAAPVSATLTSNSQSKSQMPDEVERSVSIQTATAIAAVAEMVRAIEEAGSLTVGSESLESAIKALDDLISILDDNLGSASEEVLLIGDVVPPDENAENADDSGRSALALKAAVNFVTTNIDGEVTDRALAEFLLREARQAQRALALARVAAENQNADLMRLAVLRFDQFTYAAVSYSVVWSLVPPS